LFNRKLGNKIKQKNINTNIFLIMFKKYLFSNFILLDNYNIINFVNNKILFNKGFFIFYKNVFDIIEASIFVFFIIG
jgi:hypothetical protein